MGIQQVDFKKIIIFSTHTFQQSKKIFIEGNKSDNMSFIYAFYKSN